MSRNLILEGLSEVHHVEDFFESLRGSTNKDINEEYDYMCESDEIDEASVVTFDGQTFPDSGVAVVLVGSPGSGKGYIRSHKILGSFKVFDVDRLKELYMLAQEKGSFKDTRKYDLKNPADVSALHQKVKDLGLKDKQEEAFYNNLNQDRLPNVLYDITGDEQSKLKKLGEKLSSIGYKVSLVWVVTNRQVAMLQNLSRDRVVSQQIFHKIHNEVIKNVFPFLKNGASDYHEAWLVFNSKDSAKALSKKERDELNKIGTVRLEKSGNGFNIPKEIEMMLFNILGPMEEDPQHPRTYKDFSEVDKEEIERVKAGVDTLLKKVE